VVAKFNEFSTVAIDLETTGLNPHDSRILLCQVGFPDKSAFVIDASKVDLHGLIPYLIDKRWVKIMHNAKFDQAFLNYYLDIEVDNIYDTMIAEQLIVIDAKFVSLKGLVSKYLGIEIDKDIRKTFIDATPMSMFSDAQLEYAANDVIVLFPIYEQQKAVLAETGQEEVANLEFALTKVVANMELTGVPILTDIWEEKLAYYRDLHESSRLKMHQELFDVGGLSEQIGMFERDGINLNSPKQIKEAFLKLGINIEATNEREISLLDHPAAKELLEYRKYQKILSSYDSTFLDAIRPFTGRIHPEWQQIGTATGRFACRSPNLQQMPDEFRQCVGLKGYKVVVADYSQIELRILGELSQDHRFIDAFNQGKDLHTNTASLMFNTPFEKVTKDQRFIAKTINFGIAYGLGPYKLMDILNAGHPSNEQLSIDKVREIFKRYRNTYREVIRWLERAGNIAYHNGYSVTMLGRRRYFHQADDEKAIAAVKRQGANSPIQGTNADITKLAMIDLYKELKDTNFKAELILQVHDEIVVLAHNSQAEAVKEVIVDSMIRSAKKVLKTVPVVADAFISDIWKKG
jgi:DNA polymerase-1